MSVSHRSIFGLNGIGAVLNFLLPFRTGDLIRFFFLARKKVGFKVALYFVSAERLSDLLIANSIFFVLGFLLLDLTFSPINLVGILLGAFGVFVILFGAALIPSNCKVSRVCDFLKNFEVIFGWKSVIQFFLSLTVSWGLTTCALLILSRDNADLLQQWVSVNSSFNDPNSVFFKINSILLVTLLIPLLIAYVYSYSIPSPKTLAKKAIGLFFDDKSSVDFISEFKSSYAGSGAVLFQTDIHSSALGPAKRVIVRVENRSESDSQASHFMLNAPNEYRFPEVLYVKDFARSRCTVLEFIADSDSLNPSKNAFELMIESDSETQFLIIDSVVQHIEGFHVSKKAAKKSDLETSSKISTLADLEKRILRAKAFIFVALNQSKSTDRQLYIDLSVIGERLISSMTSLANQVEIGDSHGDSSMSNFLFQKLDTTVSIRSIDPNPRFKITNIEYDLAKVMQSTHALYEFLLLDFDSFPKDYDAFKIKKRGLGWSRAFDESISNLRTEHRIDRDLLNFFFITHLYRIAPYKVHSTSSEFRRYLNLLQWSFRDANF